MEFRRCCGAYSKLDVAVAWLGDPRNSEPFNLIREIARETRVVAGVAFSQTHPEAIRWFIDSGSDIRIFAGGVAVFHPKIYLFRERNCFALFVGSSNFTKSGFTRNQEANCLIEGTYGASRPDCLKSAMGLIKSWRDDSVSFVPSNLWLAGYRRKYRNNADKHQEHGIGAPQIVDERAAGSSWIAVANWDYYYERTAFQLAQVRGENGHLHTLDMAAEEIPVPWSSEYFANAENRRAMNGLAPYAWFGHVGANGDFRRMLANGTEWEQAAIVESINSAANLQRPLDQELLKRCLDSLVDLGPTMKVWSRLLCLVRPDLYCTIASHSVRRNFAAVFGIPQTMMAKVDGYIQLLEAIHSLPWFNSPRPAKGGERRVWERRVALLDAVIYGESSNTDGE